MKECESRTLGLMVELVDCLRRAVTSETRRAGA